VRTLVLLLTAPSPDRVPALDEEAAAELDRLRAMVPGVLRWQRAGRLAVDGVGAPSPWIEPHDGYRAILSRGLSNGVVPGGFDVAVDLSIADGPDAVTGGADPHVHAPDAGLDALAGALDGLAGRLGTVVDPARSVLAFGDDRTLLDGHGTVQLFYCMRRIAGVTHDEFSRFWFEQHSQLGKATPGLAGYHQLHVDPHASAELCRRSGLAVTDVDGVALEWFATIDGLIQAVGSAPTHARAAKSSEQQFNDLDGVATIVGRVLEVGDPERP
jgi:EthD domain